MLFASTSVAQNNWQTCGSTTGKQAIKACQQLLIDNPRDRSATLNLADRYMEEGLNEAAVGLLEDAQRKFRNDDAIAAKLELAKSNVQEMRMQAERDIMADKKTPERLLRIRCFRLTSQRALGACDALLRADERNPRLHARRGAILSKLRKTEEAIHALEVALKLGSLDPEVQSTLDSLCRDSKKLIWDSESQSYKFVELCR